MTTKRNRALGIGLVVLGAMGAIGCGGSKGTKGDTNGPGDGAATAPSEPASPEGKDWYRAELTYGDDTLPFYLQLPSEPASGQGLYLNGSEKVAVKYEWTDSEVSIVADWPYVTEIIAEKADDGTLSGEWTRDTPLWGEVVRPFMASPVASPDAKKRFAGDAAPAGDISGTWRFKFETHGDGKGNFNQTADGVLSAFIRPAPLGDFRFMSGNLRGNQVLISTFNGNAANLVKAELSADGKTMKGTINMQNVWIEPFTAEKVEEDFELVNPIRMKKGSKKLSVKNDALKKYKGKPTIVKIFATWCPSCNDAAPFMTSLYEKYHSQGLEMLSISYDLTEDTELIGERIAQYSKKHGVTWEVVAVPTTPQNWAKDMPPEIEEWAGFPITVFIKRDGSVHKIYGGFFGPASGEEHEKNKAMFEQWTQEILMK